MLHVISAEVLRRRGGDIDEKKISRQRCLRNALGRRITQPPSLMLIIAHFEAPAISRAGGGGSIAQPPMRCRSPLCAELSAGELSAR